MTERSLIEPVSDRVVHVSCLLPVMPGRAFQYFTGSELLRSWLAPAAEVEAKIGGRYELFWQPEDRENNSTIGCRVTALATGQMVAFQWRGPKQYKELTNGADPLTHVVVSFAPEGEGTRVHLVHSGWRGDERWEEARVWQERAWTGAFEQLEKVAKET